MANEPCEPLIPEDDSCSISLSMMDENSLPMPDYDFDCPELEISCPCIPIKTSVDLKIVGPGEECAILTSSCSMSSDSCSFYTLDLSLCLPSAEFESIGCGLERVDDKVQVNPEDLAGLGLKSGSDECDLDIDKGCGLKFSGNQLIVNNVDLAGPGLAPFGTCGLQATGISATPGCGLQVSGGVWSVKNTDLTGNGLTTSGDCGLALVGGCGLQYNFGTNGFDVNPSALAGDGLIAGGGFCDIDVNWGCGLTINDDTDELEVKPSDLAGPSSGLIPDLSTSCGLKINVGNCLYLTLDNPSKLAVDLVPDGDYPFSAVTALDFAVAGNCLKITTTTTSFHLVKNSCGLVIGFEVGTSNDNTVCLCVNGGVVT